MPEHLGDGGRWNVIMTVAGDDPLRAREMCEALTYEAIADAYVMQMARTLGVGYSLPD